MVKGKARSGQALMIFAVASVVMIGFVGLAVDGGFAFIYRRQAQNFADFISKAGAVSKGNGGTDTTVASVIAGTAASNVASADLSSGLVTVVGNYIDSSGNLCSTTTCGSSVTPCAIGSCTTIPSTAAGVKATVTISFPTFFSNLLGRSNLETTATAANVVGGVAGFLGGTPLIVCGAQATPTTGTGSPYNGPTNLLDTSYSPARINVSAIGYEYEIWGNVTNSTCAPITTGSSWKGLSDDGTCDPPTTIPCQITADNGNQTGPTVVRMTGATGCNTNGSNLSSSLTGCILMVPLADMSNPCNGVTLATDNLCVRAWAGFKLTGNCSGHGSGGNCKATGILQGNIVVMNATSGTGAPPADGIGPKTFLVLQ